ncbi:MAG: hypothetical protein HXS46_10450 [Theionarchaea archaeon]|nr:MAG: hypothetical protein AYK18_12780 [Theionarchaea archaeon DG-70]MBU7011101.1 hypothetical protein [Theionarchaea archaeon]
MVEKESVEKSLKPDTTDLDTKIGELEPAQITVLLLLLENEEGLTAKEIQQEIEIDENSISECLAELCRMGIVSTADEQGKDTIWRTTYFLKPGNSGNLLSDEITVAILEHIVETGGCTKEDIVNLDSVVRESRSLIAELEQLGLIEIKGDIVLITEMGTKFFEHLQKLEELLRS